MGGIDMKKQKKKICKSFICSLIQAGELYMGFEKQEWYFDPHFENRCYIGAYRAALSLLSYRLSGFTVFSIHTI